MDRTKREAEPSGRVLVLGQDSRSFLAVVRSLGRRGLAVHVAWHKKDSVATASRYVAQAHALPPPDAGDAWVAPLVELAGRERFELVMPTNDPSVMALFERRAELAGVPCWIPSERAFAVAWDKLETATVARELGIPVPRQVHATGPADLDRIADAFDLPVVLKPRCSFAFGRKKWELLVRKAYSRVELEASFAALIASGDVLVQENHLGYGVGVELLTDRGEVLLAFQHERVHEPPLGGGSSYRRSIALDPELLSAAAALVRAMEHTGVAMVEFKRDPSTGAWVLIEVNGRFWGSLPLSVAAGADFPWALYRLLAHGERSFPRAYRTGIHARNMEMDFGWMLRNLRADRRDPTLCTRPLPRVAAELRNVFMLRERLDEMTLDDPRPGLRAAARTLRSAGAIARAKVRGLPFTHGPLRNWHARRRATELASARRVLFVCKGNICRSPFAEQAARKLALPGIAIESSGTWRDTGRACPEEAVAAARAHGVDLVAHRSRLLSAEDVRVADLILVFDEENLRSVRSLFPESARKLHRLGLASPTGPVDLQDPYGGPFTEFERCYADIASALEAVTSLARRDVSDEAPASAG